jgi:hypothetical protein
MDYDDFPATAVVLPIRVNCHRQKKQHEASFPRREFSNSSGFLAKHRITAQI